MYSWLLVICLIEVVLRVVGLMVYHLVPDAISFPFWITLVSPLLNGGISLSTSKKKKGNLGIANGSHIVQLGCNLGIRKGMHLPVNTYDETDVKRLIRMIMNFVLADDMLNAYHSANNLPDMSRCTITDAIDMWTEHLTSTLTPIEGESR